MRTALALLGVVTGCGRIAIDPLIDASTMPLACGVDGTPCDDGNICTPSSTCLAETCTAGMPPSSCIVAHSDEEFSLVQGNRGWFYGFYNLSADPDATYHAATDFELAQPLDALWRPPSWEASGDNFTWAYLARWGGHPGSYPDFRASVRRWVSDVSGAATATIYMSKADLGGDGTRAVLFVDGVKMFERSIAGDDGTGFVEPVAIDLVLGSTVDLHLDPIGTDSIDTTTQSLTIQSR